MALSVKVTELWARRLRKRDSIPGKRNLTFLSEQSLDSTQILILCAPRVISPVV